MSGVDPREPRPFGSLKPTDYAALARGEAVHATLTQSQLDSVTKGRVEAIPVACECGWDAHGTLVVRDWWNDAYPPGPKGPRNNDLVVRDDDDEHGRIMSCPACGDDLEPESVVTR